jgi:uncharacterized protein (TIGR00290 family)
VGLLTTVTEEYDRISMHGVRTSLLEQQAQSLGCELQVVKISKACTNDEYEKKMMSALDNFQTTGIRSVVCGDIFLEDVRRYREERILKGWKGVFPLWKQDTTELARRFIEVGFRAVLCCVDTAVLDRSFAGREYDEKLLAELPAGVDPCGENGEFHTFVFDGPIFAKPVGITTGESVLRDERFWFCDIQDSRSRC